MLSFKRFEKLRPIFMNVEFNEDESEINKYENRRIDEIRVYERPIDS